MCSNPEVMHSTLIHLKDDEMVAIAESDIEELLLHTYCTISNAEYTSKILIIIWVIVVDRFYVNVNKSQSVQSFKFFFI